MLAGMNEGMDLTVGESMFETIGRPPVGAPSPEQLEEGMKNLLRSRKVTISGIRVRTYDLGVATQVADYERDVRLVMMGIPAKTHAILAKPPLQFVNDERSGARYVAHMEWVEFELVDTARPTVPSYQGKDVPPTTPKKQRTVRMEE